MSDWHFGMDYDMWLYPPVDWMASDYDYELPEPIEAADIEGTLLINAEDAIEQMRRLQAENAKLRELCKDWRRFAYDLFDEFVGEPEANDDFMVLDDRTCELGNEAGL